MVAHIAINLKFKICTTTSGDYGESVKCEMGYLQLWYD